VPTKIGGWVRQIITSAEAHSTKLSMPKPEDRHAAGDQGRRHRDDALDDLPTDAEVLEAQRSAQRLRTEIGF
jgi:hypothetical protein